jgi:hypothetical protein
MRSNSGPGKSNNNLHDPTLKEQEQARGKSGTASISKSGEGKRKGTAGQ